MDPNWPGSYSDNDRRSGWDGRYFVTLILPNGKVRRQDAAKPLPGSCTIAATDNGMQDRDYYRKMLADIRAGL